MNAARAFGILSVAFLIPCAAHAQLVTINTGDVLATTYDGFLVHINTTTGASARLLQLEQGGLTISPTGELYAAANSPDLGRALFSINLSDQSAPTLTARVPLTQSVGYIGRLTFASDGRVYGVAGFSQVVQFDLASNSVAPLTLSSALAFPFDIGAEAGGSLVVSELQGQRVSRVDPVTGGVTTLASGGFLSGAAPGGLTTRATTGEILVLDQVFDRLVGINAATGEQRIVASGFSFNTGRTIDSIGDTAVVDFPLITVNLAGGTLQSINFPFEYSLEQLVLWDQPSIQVIAIPGPATFAIWFSIACVAMVVGRRGLRKSAIAP